MPIHRYRTPYSSSQSRGRAAAFPHFLLHVLYISPSSSGVAASYCHSSDCPTLALLRTFHPGSHPFIATQVAMSYYRHSDDHYKEGPPSSRRSRSPDYTRGGAAERRESTFYGGRPARSPSPYGGYDRYRSSRSPHSSRYGGAPGDRDGAARPDRYDRYDRERDFSERPSNRLPEDAERERFNGSDERYRRGAGSGGSGGYAGYSDYGYGDRSRDRVRPVEGPIPDPLDSPALLGFKPFAHVHRQRQARLDPGASTSDLSTQEMFNLYKSYKAVYTARSARKFWEEKRDAPFFAEKYGISEEDVQRRRQRRRKGREGRKRVWLEELTGSKIDGVTAEMHFQAFNEPRSNTDTTIFSRSGEPIKITSDSLPIEPCPNQLLIMRIPPTLSRRSIEEELSSYSGFQYLALGEAHANKQYYAIAWGVFATKEDTAAARSQLADSSIVQQNKLQLDIAVRGAQVKFRSAPSGSGRLSRLAKDLRQAKGLLRWLESEDCDLLWPDNEGLTDEDQQAIRTVASDQIAKRVFEDLSLHRYWDPSHESQEDALTQISEGSRMFATEEDKVIVRDAVRKELDFHLDILRQVYHCDYYSSTVCDFPEELARRSRAHFRRVYPTGESEAEREGRESAQRNNAEEGPNMGEEQWAENLDRKHALLLGLPSVDIEDFGGIDLNKLMLELATPFTREDDKEKHRCIVEVINAAHEKDPTVPATKTCDKLFRALVFVQKHVCNKHKDIIERELGATRRDDILYLNNYIRDPTRVMPPLSGNSAAGHDGRQRGAGRGAGPHGHPPHSWDDPAAVAGPMEGARMGLIRMGPSTFNPEAGRPSRGNRRRSASPPVRGSNGRPGMGERAYGGGPAPIHLGSGPSPLHLRLGGVVENGGREGNAPAPMMAVAEPLPPPPRPLDPRAARGREVRSYQDLDTNGAGDGNGEVMELEY
ncbi:unnamed protein product [Parajaminaea phylloscopi]